MTSVRRLIPWIASIAAHAVVVLLPIAFYDLTPPRTERLAAVDVRLIAGPAGASTPRAVKGGVGETPATGSAARATSMGEPAAGGAASTRGGAGAAAASVSPRVGRGVSSLGEASRAVPATPSTTEAPPQAPAAADVLSDLARTTGTPGTASGGSSGPSAGGAQIGWEGSPRRLLRRRDPQFPAMLSAAGQEVEGEARITVAPAGNVKRVEITRSSGYIEIDIRVEEALRYYLFERVNGSNDTVGTVRFRFRLEKTD
ncbi:MAG TPA: energy transducer TonB [Spirochaetia bacterium]